MLQAHPRDVDDELPHHLGLKNTVLVIDNIHNNTLLLPLNKPQNHDINLVSSPKRYRSGFSLSPKLYASASAQPNLIDLEYIIFQAKKNIPNLSNRKIFIVDLRQEPHVMLNGNAISWYGLKNQVNHELEQTLIDNLTKQKTIKVSTGIHKLPDGNFTPKSYIVVKPKTIMTEAVLAENLGLNYIRILVKDHFAPENHKIDQFIQFVKNLPKDAWIHFHCRGGRGRATTFMAMLDLIKHKKSLNLDEILLRQEKLGGITLSKTNFKSERKKWKEFPATERYIFIQKFYEYVIDPTGYQTTSWSEWIQKHN